MRVIKINQNTNFRRDLKLKVKIGQEPLRDLKKNTESKMRKNKNVNNLCLVTKKSEKRFLNTKNLYLNLI